MLEATLRIESIMKRHFELKIDEADASAFEDDYDESMFSLLIGETYASLPLVFSEWNWIFKVMNRRGKLKVLPWVLMIISEGEADTLEDDLLCLLREVNSKRRFAGSKSQFEALLEALIVLEASKRGTLATGDIDSFDLREAAEFLSVVEDLVLLSKSSELRFEDVLSGT